jgi:hypothetical protein
MSRATRYVHLAPYLLVLVLTPHQSHPEGKQLQVLLGRSLRRPFLQELSDLNSNPIDVGHCPDFDHCHMLNIPYAGNLL